jgi:hypothetical protein
VGLEYYRALVVLERTKFSNSSAKFSNSSAKCSTSSTKFSDLSTKFSDSSTAIGKQVLWSQNPQNQNQKSGTRKLFIFKFNISNISISRNCKS